FQNDTSDATSFLFPLKAWDYVPWEKGGGGCRAVILKFHFPAISDYFSGFVHDHPPAPALSHRHRGNGVYKPYKANWAPDIRFTR
ncbi:MAG: hypothetical protein AAGA10_13600, partial [Bacteroidota bacterium]